MPEDRDSLRRLLRFLLWYGAALGLLLVVLPAAGLLLERHYEALSSTGKLLSVFGVIGGIAAWQVVRMRNRRGP